MIASKLTSFKKFKYNIFNNAKTANGCLDN
ncbi:hypothetical protein NBRC113063_00777 [Apilactobacillus micheneri]|nr:hypothetical protein NBRC113063_00777 [Apilactobacillus micheneri]